MNRPIYISGVRISGPQVVYVMPRNGHYKIGCSTNLLQRYGGRKGVRDIIHVITVPDELNLVEAERLVHRLFEGKCIDGHETFALTDEDLEMLNTVRFTDRGMEVGVSYANQDM